MNNFIFKGSIFLLLFCLSTTSYANSKKDYKKTINKEFDITKNGSVDLDNKFGQVDIMTWDKNMVKIKVTVTVRADSEKESEPVFDRISIHFSNGKDFVNAETQIASNSNKSWWGWGSWNNSSDFSIDYEVYLPKTIELDLENHHGAAIIAAMDGDATVEIAHGELTAEGFAGELDLDMAHSEGKIGFVKLLKADLAHTSVDFKKLEKSIIETGHCNIDIDQIESLRLDSRHTDFEMGRVGTIEAECRHDDFEIESIESIVSEAQHTRYDIERVQKSAKFDFSHGGATIEELAAGFQEVSLRGAHATYRISVEDDATYQLDAAGSHAGISYPSDMDITYEKDKNTSQEIKGRIGNSNSKGIGFIKAQLSHGSLRVR